MKRGKAAGVKLAVYRSALEEIADQLTVKRRGNTIEVGSDRCFSKHLQFGASSRGPAGPRPEGKR